MLRKVLSHGKSLVFKRSFALDGLDFKMRKYLKFRNGFFIEAGANDGVMQSNTYYFERYFGWRGLLIEPIPELYEECRQNRPKSVVVNCALVPFDFKQDWTEMRYCNLMSLVKGAMKSDHEESNHIETGCKIQDIQTYELKVPAKTLSSVLDQYSIPKIDFLSLDVEGYELQALRGIDFNRHKPTFILVEARYREEIDNYLEPLYQPIEELSCHDVLYGFKQS